jgi:hypothetical protein
MLVRMNVDEVPTVIDVQPPHEPIHGWRDFFLHLTTITIGLLIALSLEGLVEWQHHRHLVHEAEASLRVEIQANANRLPDVIADIHKHQAELKDDVTVLRYIMKNHTAPKKASLDISFNFRDFDDQVWQTTQSTSALSYMPYAQAQEYGSIYRAQAGFVVAQQQAIRDAIIGLSPLIGNIPTYGNVDADNDESDPTEGQAASMKEKIGVLQGQLILVQARALELDAFYKEFLAQHPN